MPESDQTVILFTEDEIKSRVAETGRRIRRDYEKILAPDEALLAVGVLNGAFIFMADLVRAAADLPIEVDFVRLSSYQNNAVSSAKVMMTKNLEKEIRDRHVLIVEDIVDCGLTLAWLLDFLGRRRPASLKTAVAVDKRARRERSVALDYAVLTADDGFLVGYGLDYAEKYRNLPDIRQITNAREGQA